MNRLQRIAAPIIALTVAAAAAACGSSGDESSTTGGDESFVIGFDAYWLGNSWSQQLQAEFEAAAEQYDTIDDVIYTQSDNDVQRQISNVESMMAQGVDAIVLTPISPDAVVPVIRRAEDAGIRVVLAGNPAAEPVYTAMVNVDDHEFGRAGAEWLVEKLGGQGSIFVLNGLAGNPTSEARFAGAKEVFDQNPGIEIVATANADWDQAAARTTVDSLLAAHPDVDGVWSQGGSMTMGAIEAFEAAGHQLVPMTGEDSNALLKKWTELIAAGDAGFDSIGVSKPTWLTAQALDVAMEALAGEEVEQDQIIEPSLITADNLEEYVRPDLPDSFWSNTRMTDDQIMRLFEG
ncbi:ribose ABC transporter [Jiangella aurantiaca]|uniref:Ribose ABC transporter n=1 Tax=Jiangella aurantiaca TaxID=2530373 RepID=A0A4R5AIE1_9ACTN|nr:ABC transporter substrate-binding protein [Jiangella aurantiaca]TDD71250.1 ribose ABC transporter [Jiangella aurantiaca]